MAVEASYHVITVNKETYQHFSTEVDAAFDEQTAGGNQGSLTSPPTKVGSNQQRKTASRTPH